MSAAVPTDLSSRNLTWQSVARPSGHAEASRSASTVTDEERQKLTGQRGATLWLTGLSGASSSSDVQ